MFDQAVTTLSPSVLPFEDENWFDFPATKQIIQGHPAGSLLFCEGDDADYVYEVVAGIVCNYCTMADGRRQVISFSYPGDLIGLVQGEYHRYSSQVVAPSRIRRIAKVALLKTAVKRPQVAERLLSFATTELAMMQERFVTLNRKSAQERIASFLLELVGRLTDGADVEGRVTVNLPMRRRDIADYLGLSVETVSRTLTTMKNSGVIDLPHSSVVVIRDIFDIEELAETETGF